jgi:hypothetical protein
MEAGINVAGSIVSCATRLSLNRFDNDVQQDDTIQHYAGS